MYFNVLSLSALAFAMIRTAIAQRGHVWYSDAFCPVALLTWAHFENFLWTWQVTQVLPVVIAGLLLTIIVRFGFCLTPELTFVSGALISFLPLCGVPGLAYVPGLSFWLFATGFSRVPATSHAHKRTMAWGFAALAVLLSALYLWNYNETSRHLSQLRVRAALTTALRFLTSGFGPAAQSAWPWSGYLTCGLYIVALAHLVSGLWRMCVAEKLKAAALLLFLIASACLALSFGFGRTGVGFTGRYFLMAVPPLCTIYFAWGTAGRHFAGTLAQATLLILLIAASPIGFKDGLDYARTYRTYMDEFIKDISRGKTIPELVARHAPALCPCPWTASSHGIIVKHPPARRPGFPVPPFVYCVSFHSWMPDFIASLRRAGVAPFHQIQDREYGLSEIAISNLPIRPEMAEVLKRDGVSTDRNIAVALAEPTFVAGLRIRARQHVAENKSGNALQVFWKAGSQTGFRSDQRYLHYWRPEERTHTVWLFQTVDEIVINFDNALQPSEILDAQVLFPITSHDQRAGSTMLQR
jgi:hypothetical protein